MPALQAPHDMRHELAEYVFRLPAHRLRVVSPDVGGAFGMKGSAYPELALVLWAATKDRPAGEMDRRAQRILPRRPSRARQRLRRRAGARRERQVPGAARRDASPISAPISSSNGALVADQQSRRPRRHLHDPAHPCGGHGRVLQHQPDLPLSRRRAARKRPIASSASSTSRRARSAIDRVELRRRNMIPPAAMPFKTGLVFTYDSGDVRAKHGHRAGAGRLAGLAARRQEAARARGKLLRHRHRQRDRDRRRPGRRSRSRKAARSASMRPASATVFSARIRTAKGTRPSFRQIADQALGLAPGARAPHLRRHRSRSSMAAARSARARWRRRRGVRAARREKVIEKGKQIAAHLLEAAALDIEFADGTLHRRRHRPRRSTSTEVRQSFVSGATHAARAWSWASAPTRS